MRNNNKNITKKAKKDLCIFECFVDIFMPQINVNASGWGGKEGGIYAKIKRNWYQLWPNSGIGLSARIQEKDDSDKGNC